MIQKGERMPRPKKNRYVHRPPIYKSFRPIDIMPRYLQELDLTLDEYEAIRLADYEGLGHQAAAEEMEISRPTFTRLIEQARKKISIFLVEGRQLNISGGNVHFRSNIIRCLDCGRTYNASFSQVFELCPVCGSPNLIDLAGGFGHGRCCRKHRHKKGNF